MADFIFMTDTFIFLGYILLTLSCIVFAKRRLIGLLVVSVSIGCILAVAFLASHRFNAGEEIKDWQDIVALCVCIVLCLMIWLIPALGLKFLKGEPE